MRWMSQHPEIPVTGITKFDLYNPTADTGAIVDTDNWIDTHGGNTADTVGYNGALQNPYKTNAGVALKTLVFCAVAAMRVSEGFARQLFGEVD